MTFTFQPTAKNKLATNSNCKKSHHRQWKYRWHKITAKQIDRGSWVQLIQFKLFQSNLSAMQSKNHQWNTDNPT
jgi:hypothetical protein